MSYQTSRTTDDGGIWILEQSLGTAAVVIELFTDNNAVADNDQGQIRTLANGGGYVEKALGAYATSLDANGVPQIEWADVEWTFTGPLDAGASIKGYLALVNNVVIFEEVFPTPFAPANAGDKWIVSPVFKLGNGTPL